MTTGYAAAVAAFMREQQEGWSMLPFFQDGSALRLGQRLDALGGILLPSPEDLFAALRLCPSERVKVVILGQDPYPTPGDAHGLAFSVNKNRPLPRSLVNLFKELENDLSMARPEHGHLAEWARQGVLLLNTCLTVEAGRAGSHRGLGWETLTDQIIAAVSVQTISTVFVLWGADAQSKRALIRSHHCVLSSAHPSPLSAWRGFVGSRPFSRANAWLLAQGREPIDWMKI